MDRTKRQDNTLLPSFNELSLILDTEVDRAVPQEKAGVHYPEFKTITAVLVTIGLSPSLFLDDVADIQEAVGQGKILLDQSVQLIIKRQTDPVLVKHLNACYDYLSEEDIPKTSDMIFVFGAKTPFRAEKAAELYRLKLSKSVMVSGGNPIYVDAKQEPEADRYREILLDHKVPDAAIITEDKSITLPDNVRRSLNLLDEQKTNIRSIILVNSPYTQRRGWAIFKKHLPDSVRLYRVNSLTAERFQRNEWYKSEDSLRVVLNEFVKMKASIVYNTA